MTALEILKRYFGYDGFLKGQETLIQGVLAGRDVLGVMPTGAGKSVCFQIPALMMKGITLVVSPLISLMKDQVNALALSGIPAAFINSSLPLRQIDMVLQNAANGAYKLIYVAPERLPTDDFLHFARNAEISMLSVDEAHCISQWGQDFRPSYSQIPEFVANLPKRPVLSAFTATATARVREDIENLLELKGPVVLVAGFDRQNLYFEVQRPKDKYAALAAFLSGKKERSGIVYCSTRALVEEVCEKLKSDGYNASRYHAGLCENERHDNQDDFLHNRTQIMVATNAFGMGINKSNVSFVVHYNMPKDMESYYQEAGRAGRNGKHADCLLLYSGQDVRTNMWLIENGGNAQSGYCKQYPDRETEALLKERSHRRLRDITQYCTTNDCLRAYILKYFGENPPKNCNNCGNCSTGCETADITIDAQKILSYLVRMKEQYEEKISWEISCSRKSKKLNYSRQVDRKLLAVLRELRLAIANEQNTRAFAIFSDSTLIDMCIKIPATNNKFLNVHGVGRVKLEKYGEKFLKAIAEFLQNNKVNEAVYAPPTVPQTIDISAIEITEKPAMISVIADRINCVLMENGCGKINGVLINDWLVSKDYMKVITENGKNFKIPTGLGTDLGIISKDRIIRNENTKINIYEKAAQELIVQNIFDIMGFRKNKHRKRNKKSQRITRMQTNEYK